MTTYIHAVPHVISLVSALQTAEKLRFFRIFESRIARTLFCLYRLPMRLPLLCAFNGALEIT